MPERRLSSVWNDEYGTYARSRRIIRDCGLARRREIKAALPPNWENPEAFSVELPHSTTLGQDVINFLGRKRPAYHRTPSGQGPTSQRLSSKVELFVQEAMDRKLRANGEDLWEALLAHATNDGEYGVIVQPRTSHWASVLDMIGDDGEIRPIFRRDASSRAPSDPSYDAGASFVTHRGKSADAYDEYLKDAKAKELPLVVRILPAEMCLPIGLDPASGRVDALLLKSRRSAKSLQLDGFNCTIIGAEHGDMEYLISTGAQLILYELHTGGRIYYELEGPNRESVDATRNGSQELMVDLEKEWGLTEVTGGYFFGAHHANEVDPAKKGIPFLFPFLGAINGVNTTITAKVAFAYRYAFYGPGLKLDPQLVGAWKEMGAPATFDLKPMQINTLPGDVQNLLPPSVGRDADEVIALLTGIVNSMSPTNGMNVSDAQSGFQGGVQLAAVEHMLRQIREGAQAGAQCIAENVLRIASAIAKSTGSAVPVYVTVRPNNNGTPETVTMMELGPDDCQGDYTIDVLLPQQKFQNLALMQAGAGFVQQGRISGLTWLEEMAGFEQPEAEEDRIWVEQQLASPEGQKYTLSLAAKMRGNAELLKLARLRQDGQVSDGGTPTSALPQRPDNGAPNLTGGPNSGNPAASALGGIMQAASQTAPQGAVIAATGQPAPVAQ